MTALPLTRDAIAALIPHQQGMCLLERVLQHDEQRIHCQSSTHLHADLPLRTQGRVAAVHLCEYGAQATAVHGALLAAAQGLRAPAGMLVALRDVHLAIDFVDESPATVLDVHAVCQHSSGTGCLYEFSVHDASQCLARGKVTVAYFQAELSSPSSTR